jgi:hypothetical protein
VIDLTEDCESCAEKARMSEIIENQKSCSLPTKMGESDRNKVVSGEYTKTLLKEDEKEEFRIWYQTIAGWSKQLREALLSSDSYIAKMLEMHKDLKHLDMKKDNGQVVSRLRDMENLAHMAKADAELILKTLEMIEGKVHGNS